LARVFRAPLEEIAMVRLNSLRASMLLVVSAVASAQPSPPSSALSAWNRSTDPDALYGHCSAASSMGSKRTLLPEVGEPVTGVLAIRVLKCNTWGTEGGWSKVTCPEAGLYDFCMGAGNDGRGNSVTFGVLKASARTDANAPPDGCPAGATTEPRFRLVQASGRDPRTLNGIVTLSCGAATASGRQRPRAVECPGGDGHPYDYCLSTPNDGLGNAVTIGALRTHSSSDPNGLYGECDQQIAPGFATKLSLVAALGQPVDRVRAIDLLACAVPWGMGGDLPKPVVAVPCVEAQAWLPAAVLKRYDYCLLGIDDRNNGLIMGVSGH
jgi:hypothetical protein